MAADLSMRLPLADTVSVAGSDMYLVQITCPAVRGICKKSRKPNIDAHSYANNLLIVFRFLAPSGLPLLEPTTALAASH